MKTNSSVWTRKLQTLTRRIFLIAVGWLMAFLYHSSENNLAKEGLPADTSHQRAQYQKSPYLQLASYKAEEEPVAAYPATESRNNISGQLGAEPMKVLLPADTHEVNYKEISEMLQLYVDRVKREAKNFNFFKGKGRAMLNNERLFVYMEKGVIRHMLDSADKAVKDKDSTNECGGLIGLFGIEQGSLGPAYQTIILIPYDKKYKKAVAIPSRDTAQASTEAYKGYQRWQPRTDQARPDSIILPIEEIIDFDKKKRPHHIKKDSIIVEEGVKEQLRLIGIPKQ